MFLSEEMILLNFKVDKVVPLPLNIQTLAMFKFLGVCHKLKNTHAIYTYVAKTKCILYELKKKHTHFQELSNKKNGLREGEKELQSSEANSHQPENIRLLYG